MKVEMNMQRVSNQRGRIVYYQWHVFGHATVMHHADELSALKQVLRDKSWQDSEVWKSTITMTKRGLTHRMEFVRLMEEQ